MVGKKSGKALLREEGLERTDNGMEFSSWPVIVPINQKNYYTEYLKRDDQILAFRLQQEENHSKMTKKARDRDRALAQGKEVGPDGDIEMDDDQEELEDDVSKGTKTIVIHIGSQFVRVGLASDALPVRVPMVIAKKSDVSEAELGDGEPLPKRVKLDDGSEPEPEMQFGEEFASQFSAMSNELKIRMRINKRRVLPQSRDMVLSYNKRNPPDTISELNDSLRIEWTEIPANPKAAPDYITGQRALRIPDKSQPRYRLYWPIRHGWVNEVDYQSPHHLWNDIYLILRDALVQNLSVSLQNRADRAQYSCVFVIPDLYDKKYAINLVDMGLREFGFARVCLFQESLAATFGAGFGTACIVDIGAQKTSICCVDEGMCLENSRVNLKFGGANVTENFVKMLLYNHFPYTDINLKRRYDFLVAEELKAKCCTMQESDITVQLFDFHLRAAGQDTRRYTFKAYDEVILAPMCFFKPAIIDPSRVMAGRHSVIDRSYDIYDLSPNDPTSTAQAEILTLIAPHLASPPPSNSNPSKPDPIEAGVFDTPSKPKPLSRVRDADPTPHSTPTGSPSRDLTPAPPDGASPLPDRSPSPPPSQSAPLSIERRDDIPPLHPLPAAIFASITHASRAQASKTRDFLGGIMLVGGGSLTPGLDGHLEEALRAFRPQHAKDVMIGAPPRELDAQVVVWKGGSVFGRMKRTNDAWVGQVEWERLGGRVLGYKCMWAW